MHYEENKEYLSLSSRSLHSSGKRKTINQQAYNYTAYVRCSFNAMLKKKQMKERAEEKEEISDLNKVGSGKESLKKRDIEEARVNHMGVSGKRTPDRGKGKV